MYRDDVFRCVVDDDDDDCVNETKVDSGLLTHTVIGPKSPLSKKKLEKDDELLGSVNKLIRSLPTQNMISR